MTGAADIGDVDDVERRIGRVVGGKYRIESVLGQGGLGVVYRATHLTLGGAAAVKFLHPDVANDAQMRTRFEREARLLAKLQHPGIVVAQDFGEEDGTLYLVMELVHGTPLADLVLLNGTPMPYRRIADLGQKILAVLEVAHAEGVVHRDLKPDNVMVVDYGGTDHVKLLDFGIALAPTGEGVARLTATNAIQGTPLYMSPEQCRGRDVGPPADVYSVAVLLYELLTGEPPFVADGVAEILAQHMFVPPAPMTERGVGRPVPAELEQIVLDALAKKPEARPTAYAMRKALAAWAAGTSQAAHAERSTEQRIRDLGLSRSERGLPEAPLVGAETKQASAPPPAAISSEGPVVALVGFDPERATALASAFGAGGFSAKIASDMRTVPEAAAVVVPGDADVIDRVTQLKSGAATALPVVVVGLTDTSMLTALIRAGAGDVIPATAGDELAPRKVRKLLRRR